MTENNAQARLKIMHVLLILIAGFTFISGIMMIFAIPFVDLVIFVDAILVMWTLVYWTFYFRCKVCRHRIFNVIFPKRGDNCGITFIQSE